MLKRKSALAKCTIGDIKLPVKIFYGGQGMQPTQNNFNSFGILSDALEHNKFSILDFPNGKFTVGSNEYKISFVKNLAHAVRIFDNSSTAKKILNFFLSLKEFFTQRFFEFSFSSRDARISNLIASKYPSANEIKNYKYEKEISSSVLAIKNHIKMLGGIRLDDQLYLNKHSKFSNNENYIHSLAKWIVDCRNKDETQAPLNSCTPYMAAMLMLNKTQDEKLKWDCTSYGMPPIPPGVWTEIELTNKPIKEDSYFDSHGEFDDDAHHQITVFNNMKRIDIPDGVINLHLENFSGVSQFPNIPGTVKYLYVSNMENVRTLTLNGNINCLFIGDGMGNLENLECKNNSIRRLGLMSRDLIKLKQVDCPQNLTSLMLYKAIKNHYDVNLSGHLIPPQDNNRIELISDNNEIDIQ